MSETLESSKIMEASNEEKRAAYSRPPVVQQPHPWLVTCHGKGRERQAFFSPSENRCFSKAIPEMCGKFICASGFGWLVLEDDESDEFFLLNLSSMEKIQLPPLQSFEYRVCFLTSSPSEPNCHVMFIHSQERRVTIMHCQPGDDEYVKQEFPIDDQKVTNATAFNGKVYGLTSPGCALVVADFTGPRTLQLRQLIGKGLRSQQPETSCTAAYLVESGNELLFVRKIYMGLGFKEVAEFRVFRAEFCDMEWVEVENLVDRTIFLDESQGVSCSSAEAGTRANCIYFADFGDRNLYVFDLDERSLSMSLPCPTVSWKHEPQSRWVCFQ